MKKYFLHDGHTQTGPFTTEELKSQKITPSTMVWFEGLEKWTEAKNIPELKEIFTKIPPPFEKSAINETFEKAKKVLDTDPVDKIEEKIKSKKQRRIFQWILISLSIIGAVFIINQFVFKNKSSQGNNLVNNIIAKSSRPQALDSLAVIKNEGRVEQDYYFSGKKDISIYGQILNKSSVYAYKDFVIEVEYYSQTDTKLDSAQVYTIFEKVEPLDKIYLSKRLAGPAPQGAKKIKWKLINATGYKYVKPEQDNRTY